MTRFVPADINQLRDAVGEALMAEEPMEVLAGGSKRGLGRPMQTAHALDLSALSGIRDYAPSELVLTAGAATPLAEVEHALDEAGQLLAFEPPDWRGLLGAKDVDRGIREIFDAAGVVKIQVGQYDVAHIGSAEAELFDLPQSGIGLA